VNYFSPSVVVKSKERGNIIIIKQQNDMSKRIILTSGIIIVSLAFSATAFASETMHRTRNFQTKTPAVIGTVSSINGESITLNTRKGILYTVDASNAMITKSDSQIKVSDITNGDTLMVVGNIVDNSVSATKIVDGIVKNANFKANHFTGKIVSVNGATFTIQSVGKKQPATETIKVDGNTVFTKDKQTVSLSSLSSGQTVVVTGTKDGSVITAASVSVVVNKAGTRVSGTVEAVSNSAVSLKDASGTIYSVDISKAKIMKGSKTIQAGDKVVVFGSQTSGTTNIAATIIREQNK